MGTMVSILLFYSVSDHQCECDGCCSVFVMYRNNVCLRKKTGVGEICRVGEFCKIEAFVAMQTFSKKFVAMQYISGGGSWGVATYRKQVFST